MSTVATAPVMFALRWLVYPTTTISSSTAAPFSSANVTDTVAPSDTLTTTGTDP